MTEAKTIGEKFAAAWLACENPELDSENPHFRNKYASLKSTLKAVRNACKPQGIAYMQKLAYAMTDEGTSFDRRELVSSVTDGGEELELSRFPVECPPNPQSFGSNLTYAKRQQAQADWGIAGEPDDDGEAAARAGGKSAPKPVPSKPDPLKEAKKALWAACRSFAERHGKDPEAVSDGCLKRPDFDGTEAWYLSVAEELKAS